MISKHISFDEATVSNTAIRFGIENNPSDIQLACMKLVAEKCFEPLRTWYNKPIKVNSFFRCESLNAKVGGSKTSQHVKGEAIDLSGGNKEENKKLFDWCKENLEFDQLINEYDFTWVHISYTVKNRKQILAIK
jgi:zinc D-Ala-D-Ala carboxypeptidase